jgi:hypothetical protein
MAGATKVATACPVLVTVTVTRNDAPVRTGDGKAAADATSAAGVWITTTPEVTGPVVTTAPVLASFPDTVVVSHAVPAVKAV